jgi:hypothetical protein
VDTKRPAGIIKVQLKEIPGSPPTERGRRSVRRAVLGEVSPVRRERSPNCPPGSSSELHEWRPEGGAFPRARAEPEGTGGAAPYPDLPIASGMAPPLPRREGAATGWSLPARPMPRPAVILAPGSSTSRFTEDRREVGGGFSSTRSAKEAERLFFRSRKARDPSADIVAAPMVPHLLPSTQLRERQFGQRGIEIK